MTESNTAKAQTEESGIAFLELAIDIPGLDDPKALKQLRSAAEKLKGAEILSTTDGKLILRYDPIQCTADEIHQAISATGLRPGEELSTSSSAKGEVTQSAPQPEQ